ncbi:MAG: retroviral-like aspartic protease family protein [Bacteroidales bacterium]|jgi:hypothetical protein|nr:retroviral-like aspartic protease family protein [Bacteroidales bacterium]
MKTTIPIEIVTLGEDNSFHLFVSGTINKKKCDLLIDTGASQTVFDASIIPEITEKKGIKQEIQSTGINAGELISSIGNIEKFKLGDLKRKNWKVVLIDLSHVNETYKRFSDKRVSGLIGSDFLLRHKAIIDYKRKELILRNIKQY